MAERRGMRMTAAMAAAMLVAIAGMAAEPDAPATSAVARDADAERAGQQRTFEDAQQLVRAGRSADALPILRDLRARIESRLAGEKRMIYSGQTRAMTLMNMVTAAAAKRDAVDVGPIYGQTVFLEGFALIDLGRLGEARATLDRATILSPSNPQYLCEDAHIHARDHDAAGALAIYERCDAAQAMLGEDKQARWHAAALRGRGFALTELGRLDEAEAAYRASLVAEPANPVALRELDYIRDLRSGTAPHPTASTVSDK